MTFPLFFALLCPSVAPPPWMRCGLGLRVLGAGGQVLRDDVQIMGNDAQSDPALHAGGPVIATAVQPVAPFQSTDPPFNPGAPVASDPKPLLSFIRVTFGRLLAGLGRWPARELR